MLRNRAIVSWNISENGREKGKPAGCGTVGEEAFAEVIAALKRSRCLLEYQGHRARELYAVIEQNRLRAEFLAEIILNAPERITRDQLRDLEASWGAVVYTLRQSGYDREAVAALFRALLPCAQRQGHLLTLPRVPRVRELRTAEEASAQDNTGIVPSFFQGWSWRSAPASSTVH
jgi:hypothetical protein